MFLEKTKDDQTSSIAKIRFLREKKVEDKIIMKAFEKIYPEQNVKQLMQYTDSFPKKKYKTHTKTTKNWGLGTLGFLSLICGAIAYLGAWSSRESELESSRCAHTLELEQYRLTFELKQEKINLERQKERKQIQDIVKLLNNQSENIRRTMNVLQDSFKLLQFESDLGTSKKSAPVINDILSKNTFSKPHWMYEKISKNEKRTDYRKNKNENFKPIIELHKEKKLSEIFNKIKILQIQNKKENFSKMVSTILLYVKNIIENPQELRYRGLNVSNERYKKTILVLGAEEILKAIGFEKNDEKFVLPIFEKGSNEFITQLNILTGTKAKLEEIINQ